MNANEAPPSDEAAEAAAQADQAYNEQLRAAIAKGNTVGAIRIMRERQFADPKTYTTTKQKD